MTLTETKKAEAMEWVNRHYHERKIAARERELRAVREGLELLKIVISERDNLPIWHQPETAPRDGTQIIGDFGAPWPMIAAWNNHGGNWATAYIAAREMYGGTTEAWFDSEPEPDGRLRQWTALPDPPNKKTQ